MYQCKSVSIRVFSHRTSTKFNNLFILVHFNVQVFGKLQTTIKNRSFILATNLYTQNNQRFLFVHTGK